MSAVAFPVEDNSSILKVAHLSVGLSKEGQTELGNLEIHMGWLLFSVTKGFLDLLTLFLTVTNQNNTIFFENFCCNINSFSCSSVCAFEYFGWLSELYVVVQSCQFVVENVNLKSRTFIWIDESIL